MKNVLSVMDNLVSLEREKLKVFGGRDMVNPEPDKQPKVEEDKDLCSPVKAPQEPEQLVQAPDEAVELLAPPLPEAPQEPEQLVQAPDEAVELLAPPLPEAPQEPDEQPEMSEEEERAKVVKRLKDLGVLQRAPRDHTTLESLKKKLENAEKALEAVRENKSGVTIDDIRGEMKKIGKLLCGEKNIPPKLAHTWCIFELYRATKLARLTVIKDIKEEDRAGVYSRLKEAAKTIADTEYPDKVLTEMYRKLEKFQEKVLNKEE